MYWLHNFPEPLLLLIAAAVLAAVIVYLPRLTRRVPFLKPSDANTDFTARMQVPLFTMTALVLAFTLIQADSNFRMIDSQVTAEASQINQLDRLLTRYGERGAATARPFLRAYARSIVDDEWPEMLKDRSSEKTRTAFTAVSQSIMAIDPGPGRKSMIYGEMLKSLETIAEARDTRLNQLQVGLPAIYWEVVGFAVLILLLVSSTIEQTPFRAAVLGGQMAVLGAFIGLVFIMDTPFKGDTRITPKAIAQIASFMDKRDK